MKQFVLFLSVFLLLQSAPLAMATPPQQHQQFIRNVLAYANDANQTILEQRQRFDKIQKNYKNHHKLSAQDQEWLNKLAKQYKVSADISNPNAWKILSKRVDILPPSLIIAQAANESAWGTSRFAKQGNNYFGQWCYTPGCGIVPKQRSAGHTYEVKKIERLKIPITLK